MLAIGGLAIAKAQELLRKAVRVAALSFEALDGIPDALHPQLHLLRGQKGQIETAKAMRQELKGASKPPQERHHNRVQDPYSLRCIPQIHGPSYDSIAHASSIITRELNAVTDNPLVFIDEESIVSGGNFHGQALAMAFDVAAMALSELSNVSERRLELLLNPAFSGLNAFLAPKEGIQSGYMAAQYLSASLVNKNKLLANPSCTDSIPGNVGIEDHVSMGMTSANKLKEIVENLEVVLSTELVAAGQAFHLQNRQPKGKGTKKSYEFLREKVTPLNDDRIISYDIEKGTEVLASL